MTETSSPPPGHVYDQDDEEPDYADYDERSGRSWRRTVLLLFVGLFLSAMVVVAIGGVWVARQLDPPGAAGAEVRVEVPRGSSVADIGRILEDKGVIGSATVFRWYVKFKGAGNFEAGAFTFREDQSMADAIGVLDDGPEAPPSVNITIPEGLTLTQIAGKIEEKLPGRSASKFMELAGSGRFRSRYQPANVKTLEGLLLPETYSVLETQKEGALLKRMLQSLDATAQELGYDQAHQKVGLTPYQTIVVASLVESEAKVDEERPRIAAVIYNRLKDPASFPCVGGAPGPCLKIDASVLYAQGKSPGGDDRGYDINFDSPYNTYKSPGLPPTPIMTPGRASLAAAIAPAQEPSTFYVLDTDCRHHVFTNDSRVFERAVAAYRASDCVNR